MDDCPQAGTYVQVDSSQALNIVQGCVERDDVERPVLRVVNPKSFFFEIQPIAGGNGYPAPTLLSPGEDLEFEASTSDPAPLIIQAQMTEKSGQYLVVHMVITMLPGANQFGIQGHHVACITERVADVSYFVSAAESLIVDQNGLAAAENISEFMLDSDAVRRFITAADDCNFGPAPTWSIEGIKQIGGAVSTIMSATDYIANYFAGNTNAQVFFMWASPTPIPTVTPTRVPTTIPTLIPTVIPTSVPSGEGKIVFVGQDSNIRVINPDGTGETRLTDSNDQKLYPAWSPNGQRIAFTLNSRNIYIMNADGNNQMRLTDTNNQETNQEIGPDWSPDGQQFVFSLDGDPDKVGIYVVNTDGSGLTRLTTDGGWPVWSPDGRRIAFDSVRDGDRGIYVMGLDGSGVTHLTNGGFWLDWSPDGQRIAFTSMRDGNQEIYVINTDGSGLIRLTNHPEDDQFPTWSPDGQRIAFGSLREGGSWHIYVMNADGSNPTRIASGSEPDWSR